MSTVKLEDDLPTEATSVPRLIVRFKTSKLPEKVIAMVRKRSVTHSNLRPRAQLPLGLEIVPYIFPSHDLTIAIGNERFKVSTHILRVLSSKWASMLDALVLGSRPMELRDDNAEAFLTVMRIAHYQLDQLPTSFSAKHLVNLALLCEKYELQRVLFPHVGKTLDIKGWFAHCIDTKVEVEDRIAVAWVFGAQDEFMKAWTELLVHTASEPEGLRYYGPALRTGGAFGQGRKVQVSKIPKLALDELHAVHHRKVSDLSTYLFLKEPIWRLEDREVKFCPEFRQIQLAKFTTRTVNRSGNIEDNSFSITYTFLFRPIHFQTRTVEAMAAVWKRKMDDEGCACTIIRNSCKHALWRSDLEKIVKLKDGDVHVRLHEHFKELDKVAGCKRTFDQAIGEGDSATNA